MFDIKNWYWIVAGEETQVYSSAAKAYVSTEDESFQAWLAEDRSPTRIASELELRDVFSKQYPDAWPSDCLKARATTVLEQAGKTVERIVQAVVKGSTTFTAPDVVAWVEWMDALRAITAGVDKTSTDLPMQPDHPAGT